MSFPFEIKPVDEKLNNKLMSMFQGESTGYVQVGPKKWFFPEKYVKYAEKIYNFKPREDDVWIVTFPRTGTTVTSEMIWLMLNNLDYERSAKEDLLHRVPFLDFNIVQHEKVMANIREMSKNDTEVLSQVEFIDRPGYEILEELPSPRHVKTHMPFSLLHPELVNTCKIVYVGRNPKDVCESFYHHNRLFKCFDFQGSFEEYWNCFKNDLISWAPFWEHIEEGWQLRNHPNVFFLFYEDFVQDMPATIRKMAKFLNKPITDDEVNKLANHLHIDNFREKVHLLSPPVHHIANKSIKLFIRSGKTGENELFTGDCLSEVEKWITEKSRKIGLQFPCKK